MTNYSQLTDVQINEAVARALGWVWMPAIGLQTPGMGMLPAVPAHWKLPDGTHRRDYDPVRDWRDTGPLLEGMTHCIEIAETVDNRYQVYVMPQDRDTVTAVARNLQRAICEAWLILKEGNDA